MPNEIKVDGRLGKDWKVKSIPGGAELIEGSLAVNQDYKKKGSTEYTKRPACWLGLKLWGAVRDLSHGLVKGDRVVVTGRIACDEWTDSEGRKRFDYSINVNDIQPFELPGREGGGGGRSRPQNDRPVDSGSQRSRDDAAFDSAASALGGDDEIPF